MVKKRKKKTGKKWFIYNAITTTKTQITLKKRMYLRIR